MQHEGRGAATARLTYRDEDGEDGEGAQHGHDACRQRHDDYPQRRQLAEDPYDLQGGTRRGKDSRVNIAEILMLPSMAPAQLFFRFESPSGAGARGGPSLARIHEFRSRTSMLEMCTSPVSAVYIGSSTVAATTACINRCEPSLLATG